MIDAFSLLKRKPGLSVDAFQEHWRTEHADLITLLPGVVRYVQSHPLPEMYDQGEPAYDGVAELWANDSQVFRDIAESDAYAVVQTDEEKFLDRTAIALVLTAEHVISDGAVSPDGVKCMDLFKRRPDLSVEGFQARWREEYATQIAALPSLDRYVQYHARLGAYAKGREPAYDGIDVTWFRSEDALRQAMNSDAYARARSTQAGFLACDDCQQIRTRELVIIG
jgi:uncharacterized protein (TIGR02118 family)